jgi:hypothetical protein
LDVSFRKVHPEKELARSETDVEEKYVDTRLLRQVLWAMMPEELAPEHGRSMEARMRAYKNAAYCLRDFIEIADTRGTDQGNAARYRYFRRHGRFGLARIRAVEGAPALER